jgi:hypothetical protein
MLPSASLPAQPSPGRACKRTQVSLWTSALSLRLIRVEPSLAVPTVKLPRWRINRGAIGSPLEPAFRELLTGCVEKELPRSSSPGPVASSWNSHKGSRSECSAEYCFPETPRSLFRRSPKEGSADLHCKVRRFYPITRAKKAADLKCGGPLPCCRSKASLRYRTHIGR